MHLDHMIQFQNLILIMQYQDTDNTVVIVSEMYTDPCLKGQTICVSQAYR